MRKPLVAVWVGDNDVYVPMPMGSGSLGALDGYAADKEKGLYLPDGTFRPLRTRPPMGFLAKVAH